MKRILSNNFTGETRHATSHAHATQTSNAECRGELLRLLVAEFLECRNVNGILTNTAGDLITENDVWTGTEGGKLVQYEMITIPTKNV